MRELLRKDGCGPCIGSPLGEVCQADLVPRGDMPPTPSATKLCPRALFHLGENRPERLERNGLPHAWSLLEGAINLSTHYRSTAERSFRDALEITRHIAEERPDASAETRIQSQIITAFAPMYWERYFSDDEDMHDELMEKARAATMSELGRIMYTTWQNRYEDFHLDEHGTIKEQFAQINIMYLLLRAGREVYPASHREEKNSQSRFNHDCYDITDDLKVPIQIVSSASARKKKYDSSILVIDFLTFQNNIKSMNKKTDYTRHVHQQIIKEARGGEVSGAKARVLDRAGSYLARQVTNFAGQRAA
jgi:hypothetical protein